MQTIPDKLNALRHSIEASVQGQILDTRLHFEKQLKELTNTAEESAYGRAMQAIIPKLTSMDARMDDELPKVRAQLDEAVTVCRKIGESVSSGSQARLQKLDVEIGGFRVELPPLRDNIQQNAESLRRLASFPSELRDGLEATRADLQQLAAELRTGLEQERRRAEIAELALDGQLRKNDQSASTSMTATRDILDQTREQLSSAIQQTAVVEEKLHRRLNDFSESAAEVSKQHATEVTTGLRPEIQQAVKDSKRAVDEYREVVEMRMANLEAKMRDETKSAIAEAALAEEEKYEAKDAELSAGMSLGLAEMRRDISGVREAMRQGLSKTSTDILFRVDGDRAAAETRFEELQNGINANAAHHTRLVEKDLPKILEHQKIFESELKELREESAQARAKLREDSHLARVQMRKEFEEQCTILFQQDAEMREASEKALTSTAEALRKQLDTQFHEGMQESQQQLQKAQADVNQALANEVARRQAGLKALDETLRQLFREGTEDVRLALGSTISAISSRVESLEQRQEKFPKEFAGLHAALTAQVETHREAMESVDVQFRNIAAKMSSADFSTKQLIEELGRRSEDQLAHEAANLWAEISRVRSVCQEDVDRLSSELPCLATKQDVNDITKLSNFAVAETSEAASQIRSLEKAVDRHREWWESQARNLATRCEDTENDAARIKLRINQETRVLGTELSQLTSAANSLTHGVLTALQVIGFLQEDAITTPRAALSGNAQPVAGSLPIRRLGVDVSDLLEWEKVGKSLAVRVAQRWSAFEAAGAPSLLSLVNRKAEEHDVRRLRACLTLAVPFPRSPQASGKVWTASTTADGSVYHGSSPLEDIGGPLSEYGSDFCPVPPSGDPLPVASPRRPSLSSRQGGARLRS